ncbi:MAG TPA: stage III sporulation protein AF [Candidatus Mediterraneibacter cottocaccae]|nr:stage III sporulation protein AF [Candidatus Mediterraneibacter cottocaccae]
MLEALYGWIRSISVYLVVTAAVMHAVAGKEYARYIRFFSGLVLILLLASPLLRLTGLWEEFGTLYRSMEYREQTEKIGQAAGIYSEAESNGLLPDEYRTAPEEGEETEKSAGDVRIEVEEIRIGE